MRGPRCIGPGDLGPSASPASRARDATWVSRVRVSPFRPRRSAEALATHGDITYVGGAFRGIDAFPRWWLAAIDRNGWLTDWDPNVGP